MVNEGKQIYFTCDELIIIGNQFIQLKEFNEVHGTEVDYDKIKNIIKKVYGD